MPKKQIFLFCFFFSAVIFAEIITFLGESYNTQTTTELYLNNYSKEIPSEIGRFTNLEKLSLTLNSLKELPFETANLTKLKEINFTLSYEGMKASNNAAQIYMQVAKFNSFTDEYLDHFLEAMNHIFFPLKGLEELIINVHIVNVSNRWTITLPWQLIRLKLNACKIKSAK